MTKHIEHLLCAILTFVAVGCYPTAGKVCPEIESNKGIINCDPISDSRLLRLAGEPDIKLKTTELVDAKKQPRIPGHALAEMVERRYKPDIAYVRNRNSGDFGSYEQCDVWLYSYNRPATVWMDGGFLLVFSTPVGTRSSYYVINNHKVVSRGAWPSSE